jgi:hypothetical protein
MRIRLWVLAPILLLAAVGGLFLFPAEKLQARQLEEQSQLFSPSINQKIYTYLDGWEEDQPVRILTNYPLRFLPGLEDVQVSFFFDDPAVYQHSIADPTLTHILLPVMGVNKGIDQEVRAKIEQGAYQVIFEDSGMGGYIFVRIR